MKFPDMLMLLETHWSEGGAQHKLLLLLEKQTLLLWAEVSVGGCGPGHGGGGRGGRGGGWDWRRVTQPPLA